MSRSVFTLTHPAINPTHRVLRVVIEAGDRKHSFELAPGFGTSCAIEEGETVTITVTSDEYGCCP